jgi:hypothetical protein|tara:strand:- start:181 stop:357 length:177 start_codon:yes stop_codon:yes gene_type:complete
MNVFAIIGMLVIAGLIVSGTYWLITNLTFKDQTPNRYTYTTDDNGNDIVKDNDKDTKE